MSGYNIIKELVQEAQFRWLRPAEVLFILQNYEETQLNHQLPQKPPSGSLFLFNKRVLPFFRKDGHNWRIKKDGKNVGEAHERLKVGNDEALNYYYAHNEDNPHFLRRCYWMLNPAMEHIILVHYRDTTIGKHSAGPILASTLGSSNVIQSSNNYATQLASSTPGPNFLDGSPRALTNSNNEASCSSLTEIIDEIDSTPELHIDDALKMIRKQLSLEHVKDNCTFYNENEYLDAFEEFQYGSDNSVSLQYPVLDIAQDQTNTSGNGATDFGRQNQYQQLLKGKFKVSSQQIYIWKDLLTYDGDAAYDSSLENYMYPSDTNEVLLSQQQTYPVEEPGKYNYGDTGTSYDYEYGILPSDVAGLSAVSKLTYGNARHHNAALAIQKKYRGWKGHKDYLTLRKKVVMIRAHVRGHQARKNHEDICWAVGIVEKIILRWHRKRAGLRGFHLDSIDESVDEDIEMAFRKQRVDNVALAEAVSRVFSIVNSTPARQQYRRMFQGNFYTYDGNLSHELFYYIPTLRGTHSYSRGQGSSYIHDGNLSHEVGGVSGQAPSISDMVWDNMSSGSTHSYSHDGSAPSWNDLFNRDSSTTMTESDNLQDISWEEFEQMRIESNNFDF